VEIDQDIAKTVAELFYVTMGKTAKGNGTVVSVIGIEGSDCAMNALGKCAELTSGEVTIVNPLELQRKMRKIVDNPVIGTDVKVTAIVHPSMVFKYEPATHKRGSCAFRDIGNITSETDITFQFRMRPKKDIPEQLLKAYSIPFQLQIRYTRMDGTQCVRVITMPKKVTTDRKVFEKTLNVSVVGINAIQQSAKLGLKGNCAEAQKFLLATRKLLEDNALSPIQQEEISVWKNDFFTNLYDVVKKNVDTPKDKISDDSAKVLYSMKSCNLVGYLSGEKKRVIVTKRKNHVTK